MDLKDFINEVKSMEVEFMPIAPMNEIVVDEEEKNTFPDILPIVALKNTVLFPSVVLPINASRTKSVEAFKAADNSNKLVGVITQKHTDTDELDIQNLYGIGTIAKVVKEINIPDGNKAVFIMGRARFKVEEIITTEPYIQARVTYLKDDDIDEKKDKEFKAILSSIKEVTDKLVNLNANLPPEVALMLRNIESNKFLINYISCNVDTDIDSKQALLEVSNVKERGSKLLEILLTELQIAELKNEITNKTKGELDKQQREYFLQQQMKSIKDELGGETDNKDVTELYKKAANKDWPEYVQEAFNKGMEKLQRMHTHAPEYNVHYNYLNTLIELPWNSKTKDSIDLKKAKTILDKDHLGLEKSKDRILEYLAVLKLKQNLKSPILCFVGPPGIGKTSLGKSIANATGRKYARIALGGLHDESELRGHRKTYIGAMPGRIIQSLMKVKSSNPVFVLDEIEKIGKDFRGDPSTALLEILDPEQNNTFYDNYLELDYDLSNVLFIATANSLNDIQPALRDRMEIIHLSGYSIEEKYDIAKNHIISKQKAAHGLEKHKLNFSKEALLELIESYTRESGLRELERMIAAVIRYVAKELVMNEESIHKIEKEDLIKILGKPRYSYDDYLDEKVPGVAVGLAWTSVGGDILFLESNLSNGKGNLQLTGNLGNVMKESAYTALSYLKANAAKYDIALNLFEERNIHVHVPEGAVPKDGPSAGITMLSSLASVFTGKPIRSHLAMSGEITLRGKVLPVGGIKEKVLAAKRAGIKEIILCHKNAKDIEELNPEHIKGLVFHYVKTMDEVLDIALNTEVNKNPTAKINSSNKKSVTSKSKSSKIEKNK